MRILFTILILSGMISYASAQTSFIINNIHGPDNESITDIKFANSRYYALGENKETVVPYRKTSTLYIFNDAGELTHQAQLGDFGYTYFRILSINNNKIKLVGNIKTDTCSSILTLSEYFITTGSLTHLAHYPLCDEKYIYAVRIVPGLDNKTFFEVLYSIDEFKQSVYNTQSYIMTLDSQNNFSLVLNLHQGVMHLSVDFSGKGYIVTNSWVYEYYDRDFNHKYQYNNGGSGFSNEDNSFHHPLVNNYVLEQVVYEDNDHKKSERIMLVDSNLRVKKMAILNPLPDLYSGIHLPVYGGVSIGSYNTIWATSNYGSKTYPSYFSITRLDSDIKIICTYFIGNDQQYQINGITAFEDNGAIVYGWRKPFESDPDSGDQDIYVYKIGNECELTTSTNGPGNSLTSITAYPNPGNNDLIFSVEGFDPSTLKVELIDESGKIIFTETDLSKTIKVPELPTGQYYYRILSDEKLLGVGAWVKQ